jgi:hypothetical protein
VRFTAEHRFPASPTAVAALLVDPEFHTTLALPDLALPTVVDLRVDAGVDVLRLRYEYVGQIDPIARKLLAGRSLTWLQELRLDRASGRGSLTFAAEADPDRLAGRADATLEIDTGDASTVRRIAGELKVRVPVIGGTAERRIVPGLVRRLDVEADALRTRLAGRDTREAHDAS